MMNISVIFALTALKVDAMEKNAHLFRYNYVGHTVSKMTDLI
jgi:hypothetical protein